MLIAGAGGHAKEVLGIFSERNENQGIYFYDDSSATHPGGLILKYTLLSSIEEATNVFITDPLFVLGIGNPAIRIKMAEKLEKAGGLLTSVISPYARIGKENVVLGNGLNIMTGAVITQDVRIGVGTLVHINVTVHHDTVIGEYCELSPGCHILGKASIGSGSRIGAGAVILPGVKIGRNVTIGAGSVVTRDVKDGLVVKGVPAK